MPTDILLNDEFDIRYENGEMVRGESTQQHQLLITICAKGEWKENPTSCVGAFNYLKDDDEKGLLAEVKKEFERDGMEIKSIGMKDGNLTVDAVYV